MSKIQKYLQETHKVLKIILLENILWSQTQKDRQFKLQKSLWVPNFYQQEAGWELLKWKYRHFFFLNRKEKMCQREVPRFQKVNPAENNELWNHTTKQASHKTFSVPGEVGGPENMFPIYCIFFSSLSFLSLPFPLSLLPSLFSPSLPPSFHPSLHPFLPFFLPCFPSYSFEIWAHGLICYGLMAVITTPFLCEQKCLL